MATRKLGPINGVILDWAGTTVDFGCLAPVEAFRAAFHGQGVDITTAEARAPMGLNKKDHIRAILGGERVASAWKAKFGHASGNDDIDAIYHAFIPLQLACIRDYAGLIDGTLEAIAAFRSRGLKIGTTTGYSRELMDVLMPLAEKQGYKPDAVACATDAAEGRPSPYLVWLNAMKLGLYPLSRAVKIGDTVADIEEGLNAGMWTVGLTKCGNEIGLSAQDFAALPEADRKARLAGAEARLREAGAHYVVESLIDVVPLIDEMNRRLASVELR